MRRDKMMSRQSWKAITLAIAVAAAGLLLSQPVMAQRVSDELTELLADDDATNAQLAVALIKELEGEQFQPPACDPENPMFDDVPASHPFCPFIEDLARRGVTTGCDDDNFCPGDTVTRGQMATFIIRTLESVEGNTMEAEPNDGFDTANDYPPAGPAQGGIMVADGDVSALHDYWRVEHPGGDFSAETRSFGNCGEDGGDTILILFDADGNELAISFDDGVGRCSLIEMPDLAAGTYFVVVGGIDGQDVFWYALMIRPAGEEMK